MNGFVFSISRWIIVCACALVWLGCKQDSPKQASSKQSTSAGPAIETTDSTSVFQNGPNGESILREVETLYATAKSYEDKAVLYLSYQLEGRSIQEPQQWSTTWDRTGKLSAKLFNGTLQGDGDLLSCYVFDIDTANLDNQHLLIPYDLQLPLNQLFRDSIALHFLGGYSELPLDETDLTSAPKLIPPAISLLTNQVRNGWLQNPDRVERLANQTVDEKPCYVIRCRSQGMTSDVWVDVESKLLVQMSFPLKLLVGEVITSPEIKDVVLMAQFHEAVLDPKIDGAKFSLSTRPDSTPVRKFVALPESFPSELIGETAPKFSLLSQDGKPVRHLDFDGKITTLLWLSGRPSYSAIGKLDGLAASLPETKFHFGSVYSDSDLKSPGTGSIQVVNELESAASVTKSAIYYDSQLAASTALRVKVVPSVIVMDGDSKIQFARSLVNKNWLADVKAAVNRVANGDDVAKEMQNDYQHYLASYRQQLTTVSAADLVETLVVESTAPSATVQTQPAAGRGNIRLRPVKTWSNTEFKQSGNVAVLNSSTAVTRDGGAAGFLVFDGWRTVVELDAVGNTLARVELKLPDSTAVNRIRVGTDSEGRRLVAVFSALGKQIFLFDHAWNPAGMFPSIELDPEDIHDCQLTDLNTDGISELIVAFNGSRGIELVDPVSLAGEQISTSVATSIVPHRNDVVITGGGKIGMLKTGLNNVDETELDFRRVSAVGDDQFCGVGVTSGDQWNAVGFDASLNRTWTLSIGSQFFETELEPISAATTSTGESVWAIADTQNAIHLVSGSGKWLGDFQSESQLGGIALTTIGRDTFLLVSNQSGTECWNLNLNSSPMRPVSMKK